MVGHQYKVGVHYFGDHGYGPAAVHVKIYCGLVSTKEPFQKLFNQGMILAYSYRDTAGKYYHPSQVEERDGRFFTEDGDTELELNGRVVQWEITMAEMLSDAGYATGIFGKWHLGHTEGRFPTDQGFDEWYGIPNSSDETPWGVLDGYAESGVEGTYIYEGKKGSVPQRVMDYDLEQRALIDLERAAKTYPAGDDQLGEPARAARARSGTPDAPPWDRHRARRRGVCRRRSAR